MRGECNRGGSFGEPSEKDLSIEVVRREEGEFDMGHKKGDIVANRWGDYTTDGSITDFQCYQEEEDIIFVMEP